MKQSLQKCIGELQARYVKYRRSALKEYPTRTIFIDPLLEALGWDVRDPDEVELEYATIDGKSVDYALKINGEPVALMEAKALGDPLDDVKGITQVVGYAANGGIEWCILTNGTRYRVYSSSQKATAPNKLLFEVTLDPDGSSGDSIEQIAAQLAQFSRDAMAKGVLNQLGEEVFTTAKVRKALDRLFAQQDVSFVRIIRKALDDDTLTPAQIRAALPRIWQGDAPANVATRAYQPKRRRAPKTPNVRGPKPMYDEKLHTQGRPELVVELYRALDRLCHDLAPGNVERRYQAKHIGWMVGEFTFCSVHLLQSGLKLWLRISPSQIPEAASGIRDVSRVGHWGIGDVEIFIDSMDRLRGIEPLIRASLESMERNQR